MGELAVSILVFLEPLLRLALDIADMPEFLGFNPCFSGTTT